MPRAAGPGRNSRATSSRVRRDGRVSGFFLCWHRDGGSLDEGTIQRVATRLAYRGPEGTTRAELPGALALHTRLSDAIGAEEDLPITSEGLLLSGDLRLDDRDRLRAALGSPPPPVHRADHAGAPSDASLVHLGYRAWGTGVAARLTGDFACALLDTRRERLLLARSAFGIKLVFVAETSEFVAASNDLEALLLLPGVDGAPDERALAEFLRSGTIIDPTRTARLGVRRVPAAMQWVFGRSGPAREARHWDFPVPEPLRFAREEDYAEAFNALLDDAVRDRLRVRSAGILLSGGLDSPALAVSAQRSAPEVALRALTVSSERVTPSDEREWAERVARHLGLAQEVVHATPSGLLAHCADPTLRTPEPVDEPNLMGWRSYAALLAAHGPVAFDGEDPDALLAPPDIITALRTLPWGETWRARRAYRAAHGTRAWLGVRQLPALRRRRHAPHWRAPSWMRAELVRRHGEDPPHEAPPHPLRPIAVSGFRQPIWESLFVLNDSAVTGAPLTVALPFLDTRLLAFVFAIPPVPWCQKKEILRRAMRGSLPAEVLSRPKTPLRGAVEASVAQWRAAGGAEAPLAAPVDDFVDVARWRTLLRTSPSHEDVVTAWRVFELSRWLAQPSGA